MVDSVTSAKVNVTVEKLAKEPNGKKLSGQNLHYTNTQKKQKTDIQK